MVLSALVIDQLIFGLSHKIDIWRIRRLQLLRRPAEIALRLAFVFYLLCRIRLILAHL